MNSLSCFDSALAPVPVGQKEGKAGPVVEEAKSWVGILDQDDSDDAHPAVPARLGEEKAKPWGGKQDDDADDEDNDDDDGCDEGDGAEKENANSDDEDDDGDCDAEDGFGKGDDDVVINGLGSVGSGNGTCMNALAPAFFADASS
tara:strand:- start:380 stop:814 length:435 start_codon:yes stop_codon:yes gene_type:complete